IKYTLQQQYNGVSTPQLAIVSPIAFEDLSAKQDLPDGKTENENLLVYTQAMKEVAANNQVLFVDMYTPFKRLFDKGDQQWTIDGLQLNEEGYEKFSLLLADAVFGKEKVKDNELRESVHAAVMEKNWMWHKDFKMPNGVQAYGRRYDPFG